MPLSSIRHAKPAFSPNLRIKSAFTCAMLVGAFSGSQAGAGDTFSFDPGPTGPVVGHELFLDPEFTSGVSAMPVCANDAGTNCGSNDYRPLYLSNGSKSFSPPWKMSQLGSNFPLAGGMASAQNGGVGWANQAKSFTIFGDKRFEIATNGEVEYGGAYTKDWNDRKWVHLLLAQNIGSPEPYGRPTGNLADMTKLEFNAEVKIVYNDKNRKAGFDPSRHTSQLVLFFTVQNLEKGHPDFGHYVWLSIPIYDDNNPDTDSEPMVDTGTNALMYPVPRKALTAGKLTSGDWVRFNGDILPAARAAVAAGFERKLLKSADLKSYFIGGMNMGFESGALNIITVQMKNLSLKVDASTLYPANGLWTDMNSLAAQKPVAEPNAIPPSGFFRVDGTDSVYFSNGVDAICSYPSGEAFFAAGGAKDFSNVKNRIGGMPKMRNDGACAQAADATVAAKGERLAQRRAEARVAEAPPIGIAAPQEPAQPVGFFRMNGTDGVYFSNGVDAYCYYPNPESYYKAGGVADFSNVTNRIGALPKMRFDQACQ